MSLFQQAINALWAPNERAYSLLYHNEQNIDGTLYDLRAVKDPTTLPQFWTLSCPLFATHHLDDDVVTGEQYERKKNVILQGDLSTQVENFLEHPPFLVFEIDYLLVDKDSSTPQEIKDLQAQVMAEAFIQTNFPFTVLVHSGGKSIHVYIRLDDSLDDIARFRQSPAYELLQELAWSVFGHYDHSVFKTAGKYRLVRTPGATREDGRPQAILAVGARTRIDDLFQWFYRQLSDTAIKEITSRAPIPKESPLRRYWLRVAKWRKDIAQEHKPGGRGTAWMFIMKALAMAGARTPKMVARPAAALPRGQWEAPWLWWVSALVFNHFSHGWFFSHDATHWNDLNERVRWWSATDVEQIVNEQRTYEKFDPQVTVMVDRLMDQVPVISAVSSSAGGLPPIQGAPGTDPNATPPPVIPAQQAEEEKKGPDWEVLSEIYFKKCIPREHLIKMSEMHSNDWLYFNGKYWDHTAKDCIEQQLNEHVLVGGGWKQAHRDEVANKIRVRCLQSTAWKERTHAVAFNNGTLHVQVGQQGHAFYPGHDPNDRLRSVVPFNYDPAATCPQWESCMRRFVPDDALRAVVQEMFGYTFLPGQPQQAFFLLLGPGANFKGTTLRVLEAIHAGSHAAINLANLADKFALGTLWDKRVVIDGDADQLSSRADQMANGMITSTLKSWTGGDPMQIQAKRVQPWTALMQPKLILSANKRPKLIDPSRGVWRRLKVIRFDVVISDQEKIPDFDKILIQSEMSGILNWSLVGLNRLLTQGRFTHSTTMDSDLKSYQEEMDSVLQFVRDFFTEDAGAGWTDIRPVYRAYQSTYCKDVGMFPCSETEFRQRLDAKGVHCMKPPLDAPVYGIPMGSEKGAPYWCFKGWRCNHDAVKEMPVSSRYPLNPSTIPFPGVRA